MEGELERIPWWLRPGRNAGLIEAASWLFLLFLVGRAFARRLLESFVMKLFGLLDEFGADGICPMAFLKCWVRIILLIVCLRGMIWEVVLGLLMVVVVGSHVSATCHTLLGTRASGAVRAGGPDSVKLSRRRKIRLGIPRSCVFTLL